MTALGFPEGCFNLAINKKLKIYKNKLTFKNKGDILLQNFEGVGYRVTINAPERSSK